MKGNLGVAGVGGAFLFLKEKGNLNYAWGVSFLPIIEKKPLLFGKDSR